MTARSLNKDPDSWARVSAVAVAAGSKAQRVNVLQMALDDIRRLAAGVETVIPPDLIDALRVMFLAWDATTTKDALRYIGMSGDISFPAMRSEVSSVAEARAVLAKYCPEIIR